MSVAVARKPQAQALPEKVQRQEGPEPPLALEMLEGREAFNSLEKEWNASLARGPRDEPMLRHEWIRAWIENFAPGAALRTLVARGGRELHAAMPLVELRERGADTCFVPMTTWTTPHNDHSQRGGILLGRRGKEALNVLWDRLADVPGWDRLRVRDLPHGAAAWRWGSSSWPEGVSRRTSAWSTPAGTTCSSSATTSRSTSSVPDSSSPARPSATRASAASRNSTSSAPAWTGSWTGSRP